MEAKLYNSALYGSGGTCSNSRCSITAHLPDFNFSGEDSDLTKVTEYQQNTLLHIAAKSGNRKIVSKILESKATLVLEKNKKLETPLHIAARLGHAKVVSLLIATNPLVLKEVNSAKNTALHEAVCNGRYRIVKLLIEEDPSLASLINDAGESPLFMALDRKFYKTSLHILEKCHDDQGLFFQGRNGMTAMHAAVIRLSKSNKVLQTLEKYRRELIKRYLMFLQFLDPIRGSLFELALELPLEEEVLPKVLEKCGRGILQVRDNLGWLPLHYAAELGHVETVELFLSKDINLAYEKENQQGMSALHIAAKNGWIGLLTTLVKERPDVSELLDNKNRTALHVAVEFGNKDVVKTLLYMLEFRDLINDQDREGNTCLHLAALHGHYAILITLASDRRVQKAVLNNKGMTAADVIQSSMQFSTFDKRFLISTLKREGHLNGLERRIIRETNTDYQSVDDKIKQGQDISHRTKDIGKASSSGGTSAQENEQEKHDIGKPESEHIKNSYELNISSINLLVATIFASITFSAAMQMPGGYDSDGMANLRKTVGFKIFLIADSVAFGCAAASMFIHFVVAFFSKLLHVKYSYPIHFVMALTTIFITSTVLAFIMGANVVFKHSSSDGGFEVALPVYVASLSFITPILYFLLRSLIVAAGRLPSVYVACLQMFTVLVGSMFPQLKLLELYDYRL